MSELPDIVHNYNVVSSRIQLVETQTDRNQSVRLVAVSKTKPVEDIQTLYTHGHRHFGENYFQELLEKAQVLPSDIQWHFIGHLQSAKAHKLLKEVPNLFVVETVDSEKLAHKLQSGCEAADRESLNVFIQVDTSGEATKSGVSEEELLSLARYILEHCPRLRLRGLMTIGAPGDSTCFDKLSAARQLLTSSLGLDEKSLELSMGMSGDFEEAIVRGATSVRIGSTIFGERIYPVKT
jgi:PLP dependent protein